MRAIATFRVNYYYTLFLTDPRVLVPIRLQITQNVKSE